MPAPVNFKAVLTQDGLNEIAFCVANPGNSIDIAYVEFGSGLGSPGVYYEPGANILHFSDSITSPGVKTTVKSDIIHGLPDGASVIISGTSNYDGTHVISNVNGDSFDITIAFVADDAAGMWTIQHLFLPVYLHSPNAVYIHPNHPNWIVVEGFVPQAVAIQGFSDNGAGGTRVSCVNNGIEGATSITITGTTNYNGTFSSSGQNAFATVDINTPFVGDDGAVGFVLPGNFTVRELAIWTTRGFGNNHVFAFAKFPESFKPTLISGSGKDLYARIVLEISPISIMNLIVDPATVLATQTYVRNYAMWATEATRIWSNIAFAPGVAHKDAVYWDAINHRFDSAIADGTIKQNVLGFADLTNNWVVEFGDMPWGAAVLTEGDIYYLSTSVAGGITNLAPALHIVKVGTARKVDMLEVDIFHFLGPYEYPDGTIHFPQRVFAVGNPVNALEVATKQYVDNAVSGGAISNLTFPSRSFNTIYHNTGSKPIFVSVWVGIHPGAHLVAYCDSNPIPTSAVAAIACGSDMTGFIFFIVLPSYYYKVEAPTAFGPPSWVEWY